MTHDADPSADKPSGLSRFVGVLAWLAFASGLIALILALTAPLGFRNDLISLQMALQYVFAGALLFSVVAVVLFVLTLLFAVAVRPRPRLLLPLVGAVIGGGLLFQVLPLIQTARDVPPIHDITTDTENPPQFVALVPLRARDDAMNGPDYAGGDVAEAQREAYPDIQPLIFPEGDTEDLLRKAEDVARELGWSVKAVSPLDGRLEATQSTFWFDFTDDIVVRVMERDEGGVRMDIRSKSRFGVSDLGVNASRIRAFMARMKG